MAPQEEKKNIVIIGAGIIGCTSAYYLTRHPSYNPETHKITLLDAGEVAGGASGKAGGLLALWAYPSSLVPLSFRLHKELAEEHGGAERWGYRGLGVGQVDCKGRDVTQSANGTSKGEDVSLQKRSKDALKKLTAAGMPPDLDWVDAETKPTYDEMGDETTTAQVHPYLFTTSMAALASEKGVEIRTHTPVKRISYNHSATAVESITILPKNTTVEETLPATDIVLTTGPWTPNLLPNAPIAALRAHSVVIKPSTPLSPHALFTHINLPKPLGGASATPEIYPRPDGTAYACGEGDHTVPLPQTTADVECDPARCEEILSHVSSISTPLRTGEVLARQACYLPNVTAGQGPLVGLTGTKGLVLAAGHTCWGIQNGPGTGRLVSEFVFEGEGVSARVRGLDPRNVL